jgi:uncharacterized protein
MMERVRQFLGEFWATVGDMSPYLLFGFFIAGVLSVLISQRFVQRHLGGNGLWPILKAAALGVPLPLCSCSVIPVSMSLRAHGASKGSTVAFLLSTPQTGVDSIFVTLSLLGPVFAVFRPVAALVTGLLGGMLTEVTEKVAEPNALEDAPVPASCCACGKKHNKLAQALTYSFVTLPRDIGKALLIGLALAALLAVVIPDGFFAEKLGTGIGAMLVMMVLGIPMYVCATASIPIAAALILKGITPGAALVFLMTGPATNAASLAILWKVLGKYVALTYIATVAISALASGWILDMIVAGRGVEVLMGSGKMLAPWVKHVSALVLIGVIGVALYTKNKQGVNAKES